MLASTSDEQMPGVATDDTCTRLEYTNDITSGTAGNDTDWMVDRPYADTTYSGTCAANGTSVLARTEDTFDGHAFMAAPSNGNVTQHLAFTDATHKVIEKRTYDALGRIATTISPNEVAAGTNGATTTIYSPSTGYPYNGITTTTPPASTAAGATSLSSTVIPYSAFGTPKQSTDANGQVTTVSVDALGRTTAVYKPGDGTTAGLTYDYLIAAGSNNRITTKRRQSGSTYVTTYDYLDGFGRPIQTQLRDANDSGTGRRLILTRYDSLGQKAAVSQAFGATGAPGSDQAVVDLANIPNETRYGYDSAGRVYVATQYANGGAKFSTHTTYRGTSYTIDAPVHSDVQYFTDFAGRTTKVTENSDQGPVYTSYGYTPLGDLKTITDDAGNVTSYGYDWMHRRTSTSDPDTGLWSSTYNDEGDVLSTTDAKQETVTLVYDRLRRHTDTYAGSVAGTLLAHWTYDKAPDGSTIAYAKGRATAATSYSSGAAYTTAVTAYDAQGHVTGKRWDIPSAAGAALAGSYSFGYHYNAADTLTSTDYPASGGLPAETVTSGLNLAGAAVSLTSSLDAANPYVASTTFDLAGRLATRNLVGGVTRNFTYDTAAGRLSTIQTTAPLASNGGSAATIESLVYGYDNDSNVTSIADTMAGVGGVAQRECFNYDPLNRLTSAFTTSATSCTGATPVTFGADPYSATYTYNPLGDITSSTIGGATSTYAYPPLGAARPHAVSSINGSAYGYDNNGATTTRPTSSGAQTLSWNKLHQLDSVTGPGASTFVYAADGTRLLRTSGSTTTLYLDGMELTAAGSTVNGTRYYGPAMRTTSGVTVLLHNHQDSTTAVYDVGAQTASYQRYTPYGSRRGSTLLAATEHRFLDKSEDSTGLDAVGARYYDPVTARFVTPDPMGDVAHPQSFARYSYAAGNPVTFSDPSGLMPCRTNCDDLGTDASPDEQAHSNDVVTVGRFIQAGLPIPSKYTVGKTWTKAEKETFKGLYLQSPCWPPGNSACMGNTQLVFHCAVTGGTNCVGAAHAAKAAGSASVATLLFFLGQNLAKSLDAAGAAFDGPLGPQGALATDRDEAVFWSGIEGSDTAAAKWAASNGGTTLETRLAERGIELPKYDPGDPVSVASWEEASAEFAAGARGDVVVLQENSVRVNSTWSREYGILTRNSNVTSITAVNPQTGESTVLWTR
jgi:RHS repeat-associated protein